MHAAAALAQEALHHPDVSEANPAADFLLSNFAIQCACRASALRCRHARTHRTRRAAAAQRPQGIIEQVSEISEISELRVVGGVCDSAGEGGAIENRLAAQCSGCRASG